MLVLAKIALITYECPRFTNYKQSHILTCNTENCDNPTKLCWKDLEFTHIPDIVADINEVQTIINNEIIQFLKDSNIIDLDHYFYSWYYMKIEDNKISHTTVWNRTQIHLIQKSDD